MRHAQAELRSGSNSDEESRITASGKESAKRNLLLGKNLGLSVDYLASSPLIRARETSELVTQVLEIPRKAVIEPSLEPTSSPQEIYSMLAGIRPAPNGILIISHQPLLGYLLSDLLGTDNESRIEMSTASIAKIMIRGEPHSGSGTLIWLVSDPQKSSEHN